MTRKLDKEHVETIQKLQERFALNARYMGSVAIELELLEQQRAALEENKTALMQEFTQLREEENKLIEDLKARYGEGQINIIDGTFTPNA